MTPLRRMLPMLIDPDRTAESPMAGTCALTITQRGTHLVVKATTNLADPFYWWFVDGRFVGMTRAAEFGTRLNIGDQAQIACRVTASPHYDPARAAVAVAAYPATRTYQWFTSIDASVGSYRVQYAYDDAPLTEGEWTTLATIKHDGRWVYEYTTPRLDDIRFFFLRVQAVSPSGNVGAEVLADGYDTLIVRKPEMPNFTASYNSAGHVLTLAAG